MSKEDQMRAWTSEKLAGLALAVLSALALAALGLSLKGCGGECNWKGGCRPDAAPAALVSGCAPTPPPDAGCDGLDGCINTGTTTPPFPE